MITWDAIVRFKSNGLDYWTAISPGEVPSLGAEVMAYRDIGPITIYQEHEKVVIEELQAPLPSQVNPIICIGINYRDHAVEANLQVPSDPVMWYKPPTALANPGQDIPISAKAATANFLDYEGELVIVTSKAAKNVSEAEAKDYILGYTIGNDLTLRLFQDPKRGGGQFTYAKAFDKFAPIGPTLLSAKVFGEKKRNIVTRVNGKVYQNSPLDFIHSPEKLVSYLSQDTTLPAGTAIMTGTPKGVGWFQEPKLNLKDGDIVEVEVEDIGVLRNKVVYTGQ
ncbi:2-hydroxyhepta-2,4-diene-1,7-dioate isomerase [Neofusicoccum parvum]|uniref:2-hydroxyhepta-2,4-diene-1,7-dioate isomerase n=1 Tax=Neofusicoccum parvum TaxID=310453 RepID=A0ACB5SP28_9PEZI|nr:2-hydroxyhepta-2,4-diene-1,7-dioate isomerase [Neofusicoccum parvum]